MLSEMYRKRIRGYSAVGYRITDGLRRGPLQRAMKRRALHASPLPKSAEKAVKQEIC